MAISLDYYKVFYHVAKCGNITQAAEALYLTQPTVSHTIKLLEQELGCQLFFRSQKGVTMTPEAQKLFLHAKAACEHMEKAEAELACALNFQTGEIRIGASETTLHHYLLPRLTAFKRLYPSIRYQVYNSATPAALSGLADGLLDLAVLVTPANYKNTAFISRHLADLEDAFLAGPRYEELKNRVLTLKELLPYPIISMTKDTLTRDVLAQLFYENQLVLQPDMELSTADLIVPMVQDNLGIGFVPLPFAQAALTDGSVFRLCIREPIPVREIRLFSHAQKPLSVAARAFAEFLN